ncbi:MAG: hypothetical protein CM15mV62_100 [uncultured marine virus]|nr:MAG: hypothetical protein CM15mV62_100 [uncultured marine virus]
MRFTSRWFSANSFGIADATEEGQTTVGALMEDHWFVGDILCR